MKPRRRDLDDLGQPPIQIAHRRVERIEAGQRGVDRQRGLPHLSVPRRGLDNDPAVLGEVGFALRLLLGVPALLQQLEHARPALSALPPASRITAASASSPPGKSAASSIASKKDIDRVFRFRALDHRPDHCFVEDEPVAHAAVREAFDEQSAVKAVLHHQRLATAVSRALERDRRGFGR